MRNAALVGSLDRGLDAKRRNDISASQLEKWTTFVYAPRENRANNYLAETIRTDWTAPGVAVVSACRVARFARILNRLFPGFLFFGRREVLEIHVRK